MKIIILVAAHKPYRMPKDEVYLPIHVGLSGKDSFGFIGDNSGDNISSKNFSYCELTALYWGWKNLKCDAIGLVHYRRHFKGCGKGKDKFDRIMVGSEYEKLLSQYDVLLPKKRNYFIETNEKQYLHAHHSEGLIQTRKTILDLYPEYIEAWDKYMGKTSGHRFNMFVMRKEIADKYCEWLFSILEDVENKIDISSWSKSEQRVFGYLAERLLDVWLDKQELKTKDISYMFMEKQNWIIKGLKFLKRKFIRSGNT